LPQIASLAAGASPLRLRHRVSSSAAGSRLDRFLAELPEVGSRSTAERLLADGRVRVDGKSLAKSHRLAGGEEVELELQPAATSLEPEELDVRIAFADEHLLVVDKPAGVVVHPGAGHSTGTLVQSLLGAVSGGDEPTRPGIVHRLDRDTSGLLLVARTDEAHRRLQSLIRRRAVERAYVALVRGRPRSRRGRIEAPIGRDRSDPTRQSLDTETPREAVTHFELQDLFGAHALLEVRLETGRTHQIRVHLAAIGLPVSGDRTYGVPDDLGLERQFLHAAKLGFPHPFGGERIEIRSPLPADLQAALERVRAGDA
jgi:23S rRNA pseudouridine1911/1915/1917 synthase